MPADPDAVAPRRSRIALIGFGEAAQAFAAGWRAAPDDARPERIAAYDVKTDGDAAARAAKEAEYAEARIDGCATLAEALSGADVVFSLVTADQAAAAAQSAASRLAPRALYFDCNSCAPQTKAAASAWIDAAGGRYVDAAVMAAAQPERHRTPMLLSGPHAQAALGAAVALDMVAERVGDAVGAASAIKLTRSVMVKGIEALAAECLLAAERLGVGDAVLASLQRSHGAFDWRRDAELMLERMTRHGLRRAAEMQEAAVMLEAAGSPSGMARATAAWQKRIGEIGEGGAVDPAARARDLAAALDASPPPMGETRPRSDGVG